MATKHPEADVHYCLPRLQHHVYLDNARKTNALIRSEILTAARRSRERAAAEAAQNGGA